MSASTVSITANQGPTTRRRAAEKNFSAGGSDFVAAAAAVSDVENRDARLTAGETAAAILRDARKTQAHIPARKFVSSRKSTKPRWQTIISVITKNLALLVVLLGFVQMIRWVVMNSGREGEDISAISGDFEGKLSEVERFVKTTTKAMQVQLSAFDKKFEDGFGSVRKEFDEKIEKQGDEMDLKVKALGARSDAFEKFMDGFGSKSFLSQEEFGDFFDEFKKATKDASSDHGEVSLDEIRNFAREIVEKEIERHAADGLGMVDYALGSGGGRVVRHSEQFGGLKLGKNLGWLMSPNRVSVEAEQMIKPSFGEPGHCFALKGQSGFVEIRLRTAIVPEAVTLEHVAKSVAYDRSSAPKQCRVSGWMQGKDSPDLGIATVFQSSVPPTFGIPLAGFVLDDGSSSCCCWTDSERAATLLGLEPEEHLLTDSAETLGISKAGIINQLNQMLEQYGRVVVKNYGSVFDSSCQDIAFSVDSDGLISNLDEDYLRSFIMNAVFSTSWTIGGSLMDTKASSGLEERLTELNMTVPPLPNIWATSVCCTDVLAEARNIIQGLV